MIASFPSTTSAPERIRALFPPLWRAGSVALESPQIQRYSLEQAPCVSLVFGLLGMLSFLGFAGALMLDDVRSAMLTVAIGLALRLVSRRVDPYVPAPTDDIGMANLSKLLEDCPPCQGYSQQVAASGRILMEGDLWHLHRLHKAYMLGEPAAKCESA